VVKRRGNKEGTIYKRGSRWCAQISLDGRRLTKYFDTQRECREWIREKQAQIDEGLTFDGARATLEQYLNHWLETTRPHLRAETQRHYTGVVRRHIIPALGQVKLNDLRPDHIQSFYIAKRKAGVSEHVLRYAHAAMHRALGQAVKWGLITRNPTSVVDRPKPKRAEMKVWTVEQVRTFLTEVEGDRFEALYYIAVTTGLRMGELLGLLWSDLNWETARLQIQRQLQRVKSQGLVFNEPKSRAGRRSIVLGPDALDKLHQHRERQQQERLFFGESWQESGLIFPSLRGTPKDPTDLRREFKALVAGAGLPGIRFHDLRHTAATLMLQQGIHPKVVQERLGHSSISITLDTYSHVLPNLQVEAAEQLEELIR
jgi:integrase